MVYTRREFLKASLAASTLFSLCPAVPTFLTRSALAGSRKRDARDTILIMVQLAGGNDGLNTVVPYGDDLYARNRRTLRLEASQVHKIDSLLGFHPRMQAFMKLYQEGHLCVVQGVGYPNSSRSHFDAMQVWHTAKPNEAGCQTGWLGRTCDNTCRAGETKVPAVFVGQIKQPFSLNAEKAFVPSITSLQDCTLHSMPGPGGGEIHRRDLVQAAKLPRTVDDKPLLNFLQRGTLAAYVSSRQIEAVTRAQSTSSTAAYPPFYLARMFRTIARLIRSDIGIRIFFTELGGEEPGGFDSHANQFGNHAALLHQLSESVAAFLEDMKRDKLLDRVLLMTFSEFGRTVEENGRRGTGHGAAAPMFLAGGKLKGGLVGAHPSLSDLDNGAQKIHTDFRRVYATALDSWLGFDSQPILGKKFEPLTILKA